MDLSRRGEVTADPFAPGARFGSDPVMAAFDAITDGRALAPCGLAGYRSSPGGG